MLLYNLDNITNKTKGGTVLGGMPAIEGRALQLENTRVNGCLRVLDLQA